MTRRKPTHTPADDRDEDDTGSFRRLFGDAHRIETDKVPQPKRRPPARARFTREDERQVLDESLEHDIELIESLNGDAQSYRHPSVHRRTMRRLARGGFAVQDETDLHGLTVAQAREALAAFLDHALARGYTCVRVVHGKGLRSGQRGPVLRHKAGEWLRRRKAVLAYVSARQADGGTGALYVLLDPRRRPTP